MGIYSNSKLGCFKKCPRQFYYHYVAKVSLESAPEQIAPFLGSRVHETLQHLYARAADGILVQLPDLVAHYRALWQAAWTEDVQIQDEKTPAEYCGIGEQCIRDFYARYQPFNQAKTIGLERRVVFPIDDAGQHRFQGCIDQLARKPDGTWQVHDYKTNRYLPTQEEKDTDPQLAYYEIAIRRMWKGVEQVELVWHYLRFDQAIVSSRTPDQLAELRVQTLDTIRDIESRPQDECSFPTRESKLCDYCDYQAICPVRKHLFRVKELSGNKFLQEPGVWLVDQWTELKAQQDVLDDQYMELQLTIDEIKAALALLAKKEGLETVVGSQKEVAIKQVEQIMFPRKSMEPDQAEELEQRLRNSQWWNQVSTLDRYALDALWQNPEELGAELKKLLAPFVWTEADTTLRLRNRRS